MANALQAGGRVDEAVIHFWEALVLKPDFVEAHNNLGNALQEQGRLDEAVASYRQALPPGPILPRRTTISGMRCRSRGGSMKPWPVSGRRSSGDPILRRRTRTSAMPSHCSERSPMRSPVPASGGPQAP